MKYRLSILVALGASLVAASGATAAVIVGTDRHDAIAGTPQGDVIVALAGNDVVLSGAGRDIVRGQAGNDILDGGPDADDWKRILGRLAHLAKYRSPSD